jgi:hypothetical protein
MLNWAFLSRAAARATTIRQAVRSPVNASASLGEANNLNVGG